MPERTEEELMLTGEMYLANDPELVAMRQRAKRLCEEFNRHAGETHIQRSILVELLGYPTDAYFEAPFFCDYGKFIRLGQRVYANHNLVILDCNWVTIGDDVMMGPNVVISAATHPVDPTQRISGRELAHPITIGDRVWIGASVTILPGVEIGDDTTIGAGSVVNRSIPANVVAAGNPCRVLRTLDAP
jgi:maltose O-acetyltransferase